MLSLFVVIGEPFDFRKISQIDFETTSQLREKRRSYSILTEEIGHQTLLEVPYEFETVKQDFNSSENIKICYHIMITKPEIFDKGIMNTNSEKMLNTDPLIILPTPPPCTY